MPAPRRFRPLAPATAVRPLAVVATLAALLLVLAACGDDSSKTPSNAAAGQGPGPGRGFGAAQTPAVRACLKKQGVTLPQRPAGGRRFRGGAGGPGGSPPTGTNAAPPSGAGQTGTNAVPPTGTNARPPGAGGRRFGRGDPAQFAKLRAALAKCGVTPPTRGQGGPGRPAPTTTTPGTTAS